MAASSPRAVNSKPNTTRCLRSSASAFPSPHPNPSISAFQTPQSNGLVQIRLLRQCLCYNAILGGKMVLRCSDREQPASSSGRLNHQHSSSASSGDLHITLCAGQEQKLPHAGNNFLPLGTSKADLWEKINPQSLYRFPPLSSEFQSSREMCAALAVGQH